MKLKFSIEAGFLDKVFGHENHLSIPYKLTTYEATELELKLMDKISYLLEEQEIKWKNSRGVTQ